MDKDKFIKEITESLIGSELVHKSFSGENVFTSKASGKSCKIDIKGKLKDERIVIYYQDEDKSYKVYKEIMILDDNFTVEFIRALRAIIGI